MRRAFGMIFQDFQLFPHLSVLDNVTEAPIRVMGLPATKPGDARNDCCSASAWRITSTPCRNSFPAAKSSASPSPAPWRWSRAACLCDEITSALDPELKNEVLGVLEDLKRDGLTMILVTHEIGFARRAADRVVMLCDGRILEQGPPAEVLDRPRTERMGIFFNGC